MYAVNYYFKLFSLILNIIQRLKRALTIILWGCDSSWSSDIFIKHIKCTTGRERFHPEHLMHFIM